MHGSGLPGDHMGAPEPLVDNGLECFSALMSFFGKAVDGNQVRHDLGIGSRTVQAEDILRAARLFEAKAKAIKASPDSLAKKPLPCLAQNRDGSFVVLLQAGKDQVLIFNPLEAQPRALPLSDFTAHFSGQLILVTTREHAAVTGKAFDVTWFIPAIIKYRHLLRDVLLASFFLQILGLITPLFFQVVIDKVLVHKGFTTLEILAIGLLCVTVFDVMIGGLRTYLFSHTTSRVDVELGAKLFKHLTRLPMAYFQARRVGDTVARVRELENIREFLTSSALTAVLDLFFSVVFLVVMAMYSLWLLLIVLITLPLYALIVLTLAPVLKNRLDEKFARGAESQSFLVESVTAVETLKASAVEPQSQERWEGLLAAYVKAGFLARMIANWGSQAIQLVNKIGGVALLFFGARLVIDGHLTVGELVAFNMLAGQVAGPVLRIAQLAQDFQQAKLSVERLGDILNAPTEPVPSAGRGRLPDIIGDVRIEHMSFRYRFDGPEILSDVSLNIAPGEVLGIVGPSGSGKSTLTKLIQRLHTPERGRVLVDGMDISLLDPSWLRRQVGVVLQENILFNRTVREKHRPVRPGHGLGSRRRRGQDRRRA
jgi:subfamily B ATP-binding cassette protein HlyB/CyaB